MNALTKKIGDRVIITAGEFKGQKGILIRKQPRGWEIELDSGQKASILFPLVALVQQTEAEGQTTSCDEANPNLNETRDIEATPQDSIASEEISNCDHSTTESKEMHPEPEINPTDSSTENADIEISELNVIQLKVLAMQRGVGIARTKEDFMRIIKDKFPDEDLTGLKGKALFDRVSELHISRLRSKAELIERLSRK